MLLSLGTAIFKWQLKPPECSETANKSESVKKKEECCNKESGNEGGKKEEEEEHSIESDILAITFRRDLLL